MQENLLPLSFDSLSLDTGSLEDEEDTFVEGDDLGGDDEDWMDDEEDGDDKEDGEDGGEESGFQDGPGGDDEGM